MAKHRHTVAKSTETAYLRSVSHNENRAAHGGICIIDTCACGAERRTNVNGRHTERGPWDESETCLATISKGKR